MGSLVRTYTENGTETRDERGGLVEYTVLSGPSEARYSPEGSLLDTTVTTYTEDGSVLTVQVYDPAGQTVSRTEFDYDPLGFLLRPYNLAILALVWAGMLALICTLMLPDGPAARTVPAESLPKSVEKEKPKGKRSYAPLLWLGAYLLNLLLVLAFQAVFFHNIPLPEENAEGYPDFSQAEFFEGCTILDTKGGRDEYQILYRDPEGRLMTVRLEGNLYFRRYGVIESTVTQIPEGEGDYTFEQPNFLGKDIITVTDGQEITRFGSHGLYRQQATIQGFHVAAAIVLLLPEGAAVLLIKKRLRR